MRGLVLLYQVVDLGYWADDRQVAGIDYLHGIV